MTVDVRRMIHERIGYKRICGIKNGGYGSGIARAMETEIEM